MVPSIAVSSEVSGYLVVVCYLTLFWFSLLTPCYFAGYSFWFMKTVKESYGKKTGKEDRRPKYLLDFDFISWFNNHSVGEKILPESK